MSSELILNQRRPSVADPTQEQVRCHARDLVELVRVETGLSHSNSQSVVQTVLGYVCTNLPRLDKHVPALLSELEHPVLADKVNKIRVMEPQYNFRRFTVSIFLPVPRWTWPPARTPRRWSPSSSS